MWAPYAQISNRLESFSISISASSSSQLASLSLASRFSSLLLYPASYPSTTSTYYCVTLTLTRISQIKWWCIMTGYQKKIWQQAKQLLPLATCLFMVSTKMWDPSSKSFLRSTEDIKIIHIVVLWIEASQAASSSDVEDVILTPNKD